MFQVSALLEARRILVTVEGASALADRHAVTLSVQRQPRTTSTAFDATGSAARVSRDEGAARVAHRRATVVLAHLAGHS